MTEKPSVVHLIASLTQEASGPSYSVVRLCGALAGEGERVTLLALDADDKAALPPFVRTCGRAAWPHRLGRSPGMLRWLRKEAGAGRIDILHGHGMWMMPNVYPGWVAGAHRIPYVVSPRGTFTEYAMSIGSKVKTLFWPLVQRPALRAVTCFHATSEAECADIRRMGFRQPVAVIPNGIDDQPFEPPVARPMRTLLYLGRIHPEKGVETLLHAWGQVQSRFPSWRLRIVGPGKPGYVAGVKQLASDIGLERVEFAGPAYGNDKWVAYRDADLYVLPSPSENFGMTVAEALIAGRPAIATQGAPWRGLETEGAGLWPAYGVEPLARALAQAMALPFATLSDMGVRGREWMLRDFSWSGIGAGMDAVYQWLLRRGERPACVITD